MNARWTVVALAAAMALGLAACETDDFGEVGSGLPTDVSQDSLLIEAPDLEFLDVVVVEPDSENPIRERQTLFLGNRDRGGIRATPVMRFDFDETLLRELLRVRLNDDTGLTAAQVDAALDTFTFDEQSILSAELEVEIFRREVESEAGPPKKLLRRVRLFETSRLVQDTDDTSTSVATLLGDSLGTRPFGPDDDDDGVPDRQATQVGLALPIARVVEWIADGTHDGLAVYDLAPGDVDYPTPHESNVVAFAGSGFLFPSTYLEGNLQGETIAPEVNMELDFDALGVSDIIVAAPVVLDFTVLETAGPPPGDLFVGSYLSRRTWLQIDVDPQVLPPTATINQALLELTVHGEHTLGTPAEFDRSDPVGFEVLESTRAQATRDNVDSSDPGNDIFALGFVTGATVSATEDSTVTLNITRYVQRVVNEVLDPTETGLLLRLVGEEFDLERLAFHGPEAADPALRPRVRVTYTPPADSWR